MEKIAYTVAIYARVSSEQQADASTIESQVAELKERLGLDGFVLAPEFCFVDNGYSGAILLRPGLERLRDVVSNGVIDCVYVHSPDRLARRYAYQVLLVDEFHRSGVEVVFVNQKISQTPEDELLLQVQGMIAEYERAKIMERSRRGKRHAAAEGRVSVLSGAPYGYLYVGRHEGGGEAYYEIVLEEARVVRQLFEWVGKDRVSISEVCRRLERARIRTRTGKNVWDRATVWGILRNPAYKGRAAFGKTRAAARKPQLRPQRGQPQQPKRTYSTDAVPAEEWIEIPVPAIVDEDLFSSVAEQLEENRKRNRQRARGARYLLQGLLVCKRCGYSYYGKPVSRKSAKGKQVYSYYRCIGTDAYRFGGERICNNPQVRTDMLDSAVWDDVRSLLTNPQRIREEYHRRLTREKRGVGPESVERLENLIKKVRRGIARLVDAYSEGLLEKSEFEPRIRRARERVTKLQKEAEAIGELEAQHKELELVIGRIQEFADLVKDGLDRADWSTRREIIRALVKKVEVDEKQVNVVYRVSPCPFEQGPERGNMQYCWGRGFAAARQPLSSLCPGPLVSTAFLPNLYRCGPIRSLRG